MGRDPPLYRHDQTQGSHGLPAVQTPSSAGTISTSPKRSLKPTAKNVGRHYSSLCAMALWGRGTISISMASMISQTRSSKIPSGSTRRPFWPKTCSDSGRMGCPWYYSSESTHHSAMAVYVPLFNSTDRLPKGGVFLCYAEENSRQQ